MLELRERQSEYQTPLGVSRLCHGHARIPFPNETRDKTPSLTETFDGKPAQAADYLSRLSA